MHDAQKYSALVTLLFTSLILDLHIHVQGSETIWCPPASFESLKSTRELPDVFTFSNNEKVKTKADWRRRREEIKSIMQYYQYGRIPPRPDSVTAVDIERKPDSSVKGTEEWLTLVIGSKKMLRMRAVLYWPKTPGPYPVVIREEGSLGTTGEVPLFLENGYMFIEYARHDLDPDRENVVGIAQKAYPQYDWATLAVWAWGGMRVVDYLETRRHVDLKRIAITGHSRGGKMALLAAALDERFRLVVPNGSGAGGAGSYRVLGPGAESLGMNDKPHWYNKRIQWFGEKEDQLPFDQHFLKALIAPRALFCTESLDDAFANPLGTQVSTLAAQEVFVFLGAERNNAIRFRHGKHAFTTDDWKALLAFAEWKFFERPPENQKRFWMTPLPLTGLSVKGASAGESGESHSLSVESRAPLPTRPFMKFVTVGDPGNRADQNYFERGVYGAVDSPFSIGLQGVTNEHYALFLNAVSSQGSGGLFNPDMQSRREGGIVRSGSPGDYRYRVKIGHASRPVNFVSWYDALRFCNWLHNGRPGGQQAAQTTENGAYTFSGKKNVSARLDTARFALASENEWYKAAYYSPTQSSTGSYSLFSRNGKVIEHPPEWKSYYGAEQMADRVWEWNESKVGELFRGLRSGAWFLGNNHQAAGHFFGNPEMELENVGFRVVRVLPPSNDGQTD